MCMNLEFQSINMAITQYISKQKYCEISSRNHMAKITLNLSDHLLQYEIPWALKVFFP
jgi:hypothetical protein